MCEENDAGHSESFLNGFIYTKEFRTCSRNAIPERVHICESLTVLRTTPRFDEQTFLFKSWKMEAKFQVGV